MLALVHLNAEALTDSPSMAVLTTLARHHRLVLVCARCGPAMGVISALRRAMPRRRVVALLASGELALPERRLIRELLDEDLVPLVLTDDESAAARLVNWVWLRADDVFVLPV